MHPYFWRSGNTAELDFIFEYQSQLVPVEAKAEIHTRAKSYGLFCKKYKPSVAILCIPKHAAKELSEQLVEMGIKGFWNFSHYDLKLNYDGIVVENVHLGDSLMTLSYMVNKVIE